MVYFDFVFNPYALLSLFAAVTNSIVLYLVVSRGLEVSSNRWFAYVVLSLIPWCVTETFARFSANPTAADFWSTSGMMGWAIVAPLFVGFALAYTENEKALSRFLNQVLLFAPSLIFLLLGWTTNLINNRHIEEYQRLYYGWNVSTTFDSTPLFWLVIIWIDGLFIFAIWLLIKYFSKIKDQQKRMQTTIFIIAVLLPIVGGSITNGLFPILNIQFFPAAVLLTSFMSLMITYAILRYKLFVINPASVVSNIVDTMNEVLIVFNPNYLIEFANKSVESILGYESKKLIGQPFKKILGRDWESFRTEIISKVEVDKPVSGVELSLINSEGDQIPVNLSASAIKNQRNQIFGFVIVATDISRMKTLLSDITAERNKLTTVLASIADGVLALGFDGKVILVNPAALSLLGLKEVEALEKNFDDLVSIEDSNEKITTKALLPKRKPEKDEIIIQLKNIKLITKFRKQVFVNLISSTIKEGEDIGLAAIVTLNDVSKEKELEEMKLDFVSMAAHELRTPLTAIRGYLSVLQEEAGNLTSEQHSFLDKAFISSSQLAALVENLLSVSRIERGAMKLEVEASSLDKLLDELVNNFIPLAKEKNVRLSLKYEKDMPLVSIDKFRISEVLSNLIANALTYTNPGGLVEVSSRLDGKEVLTSVKDTGQGIPESAIAKLFTKFFRVSGVLEQGSKGTGLGLYISKAIIDMHKGRIWVESKLGEGSKFYFTVPVADKKEKEEKKQREKEKEPLTIEALEGVKPIRPVKQTPRRFFKRKDLV